jgi:hypothetical protein
MREYQATPEDTAALQAFAKAEGRKWKSTLTDVYWYNARIWRDPATGDNNAGYVLHSLRNNAGHDWLAAYKLPKA